MQGWLPGYTIYELEEAQERFQLTFPPDLIDLYINRRPAGGYDWRKDHKVILEMLRRPLEGLLFDIEHNALWLNCWGDCPPSLKHRFDTVRQLAADAPKLIPLYSHRYLPTDPNEAGNPVFSIVQSDIIYYGANLSHYFDNEMRGWSARDESEYRYIRFWSDLAG